jgi:hypothetical protein
VKIGKWESHPAADLYFNRAAFKEWHRFTASELAPVAEHVPSSRMGGR